MPEEWLIDGYNLLHDLKTKNKKNFQRSVGWLVEKIASFASARSCPTCIVFDGFGSDEEFEASKTPYFRAVYSKSVTADAYIERYLYDHRKDSQFVVVTKDRAISQIARGVGARVLNVDEFMEMLESAQKEGSDILFRNQAKAHGFNRPFNDKL